MTDILIVEDTGDIAEGLRINLELEGYDVAIATTGEIALERVRARPPQLLILDLMLPGIDGFHVLRRLRDDGFGMPVLILSARADETEKVRGFRIGADDYVTKPFGLREVLARVEVLMRRHRRAHVPSGLPEPFVFGDVAVFIESRRVLRAETDIELRPREFDLLAALVAATGRVVSRRHLLETVWRYDRSVQSRTVDTHIVELRRKLERDPQNPQHILTVRKAGYTLRVSD